MAGHNKWSQIKRKKAANDNARAKIITKHVRAIQTAVRDGNSGDPEVNTPLKNAISAAKSDNVAQDNIDRAIDRALGNTEGVSYDEVVYEGYGPAGVAFVIEALTDNRNRTIAEVRHVFSKHNGNLSGATAWQFDTKGIIMVNDASESMQELAIELGADDIEADENENMLSIYTPMTELYTVVEALEAKSIKPVMSQLTKVPQTETELSSADAGKVVRMTEALEDLDDVQNVYSTANLDNYDDAA